MHYFKKYKLNLVKESNNRYEIDNYISSPRDIAKILTDVININGEAEEVLILITLSTKNKVTGLFEVSRGSVNTSIVHPREVMKRALLNNASAIIIAHNHPSGDPTPSREDIEITKRLKESGRIIGIDLLDHVIIGDKDYISLKEKGSL